MKNILLKKYPSIDYALIARVREDETVKEFVATWGYDDETKSWSQGHYFLHLNEAMDYIDGLLEERKQEFIEAYENDPLVHEGWHQQDVIDMYRRER